MAGSPLKIGIIGCGAIHSTHAQAIQNIDGAELVGFYDIVPQAADQAAEKFGTMAAKTLADLFDRCDAVTLCVPSGLHHELAIAAAKAGKHVLSEKPIDIQIGAAKSMVTACRQANVKLGVVSQHRCAQDVIRLKNLVQEGAFGRIIGGEMYNKWYRSQDYYDSGDWRGTWALDGGGCLMNQGVHYVDLLQWIMGGVKAVTAITTTDAHQRIEVEDSAYVLVEFTNGAHGVIIGSTCVYPGMAERIEVHGLFGSAILEADRLKFLKIDAEGSQMGKYGDGINSHPTTKIELVQSDRADGSASGDPSAIWGNQHQLQIEDFVHAIWDDRDPMLNGEEALKPLEIILAIYESGRHGGKRIELAP